jgi:hypothetical protein
MRGCPAPVSEVLLLVTCSLMMMQGAVYQQDTVDRAGAGLVAALSCCPQASERTMPPPAHLALGVLLLETRSIRRVTLWQAGLHLQRAANCIQLLPSSFETALIWRSRSMWLSCLALRCHGIAAHMDASS